MTAKRTNYQNGDEISLSCGCDSCNIAVINGMICHEHGCPNAWRDRAVGCFECGCRFFPAARGQRVCEDCLNPPDDLCECGLPLDECSSHSVYGVMCSALATR